jgi:hypothetical protein
MKNFVIVFFLSSLNISIAAAQAMPTQRALLPSDFGQRLPDTSRPPGVDGDFYDDKRWNPVTFYLYSAKEPIEGYYGRYDIYLNEFEIMTQQGVRVISFNRVKAYAMKDSIRGTPHSYVNAKEFSSSVTGFFEIFSNGPCQLGKRSYITIRKPDYDPVLRIGSQDTKIIKETELYFLTEKESFKIKGKKQFLSHFGDKAKEIESYMKVNGLTMTERDLRMVIDYYNELVGKGK